MGDYLWSAKRKCSDVVLAVVRREKVGWVSLAAVLVNPSREESQVLLSLKLNGFTVLVPHEDYGLGKGEQSAVPGMKIRTPFMQSRPADDCLQLITMGVVGVLPGPDPPPGD
jgi:hypothetical protein